MGWLHRGITAKKVLFLGHASYVVLLQLTLEYWNLFWMCHYQEDIGRLERVRSWSEILRRNDFPLENAGRFDGLIFDKVAMENIKILKLSLSLVYCQLYSQGFWAPSSLPACLKSWQGAEQPAQLGLSGSWLLHSLLGGLQRRWKPWELRLPNSLAPSSVKASRLPAHLWPTRQECREFRAWEPQIRAP